MKKSMNAMSASLFMLAVLAAAPLYSDYIDNPNPGKVSTQGPRTPDVMGSW
jgi:hypothetical protein